MSLVIMNIAKCALRGVQQAMKVIFNIPIDVENLGVNRESCDHPKIQTGPDEYAAVIKLKHEQVKGSGFVIVRVPKKNLIPLMKKKRF